MTSTTSIKSVYNSHPLVRATAIASGIAATALTLLAVKYPDCAVFDEHRDDIPHGKGGWPLVGALPQLVSNKEKMHEFLLENYEELNTLTLTSSALGIPRSISTIDPANVEHILKVNFENYVKGPQMNGAMSDLFGHGIFNANGEQWKYQRKTASHIFNVKNFRDQFTDVFVQEIGIMNKLFDEAAQTGEAIDFHDIMFKFTLDSFILLGFGVQLNALTTNGKVPFAASFDECQKNCFQRFLNPIWTFTESVQSIIQPWKMTIKQHLEIVDTFANNVIDQRRELLEAIERGDSQEEMPKDLLSRFMKANNEHNEPLNNKELRDMILNFVIAGRDTTAQALSWEFYSLLLNPHVEEKLLEEISLHIRENMDAPALYEAIKDMKYAHAVFYETLRLYPSVPLNQKYALDDDIWPDGTHIRKGDYVVHCPWAEGRSTRVWGPDAKEFKPERWITPEGTLRRESQGQWPAFHAGPRVCLGQNLATLEALVATIFLIKRYKFTLAPDQEVTYQVSLTLPMKNGMKVYVQPR
ncbi:cytochrome P450 [Radiomyces spectabilis]|uniref:cytochrome P450 n=1 Tax=Radiomyces spectabilis TaxID=64574 RepID=UPI00221F704B|nr:cytochrome P450 [Radiomyces spectabilis]KAI8369532.1 cytochrome P450 [Radiomyces spectabilis]